MKERNTAEIVAELVQHLGETWQSATRERPMSHTYTREQLYKAKQLAEEAQKSLTSSAELPKLPPFREAIAPPPKKKDGEK